MWIERCSLSNKGKPKSEEHKRKIGLSHKGKRHTPETREKISLARIGRGVGMSEETKLKISIACKGKKISEETRKKMSAAKKGKSHPNFGKTHSIETKNKMSLAGKGKHSGEKSSNWKGGISFEPYCPKFTNEFKERVRAFFGFTCQKCGHVWQLGEKKLAVHHVNYRKDACCDKNVIPLFVPVCRDGCHVSTNFHREFWEDWFTEIINEFYSGKCYFTKEEMRKVIP